MKNQTLFRLLVIAGCVAMVPLFASAQPGGTPPTGNVNSVFSSVVGTTIPDFHPEVDYAGLYGGMFGVQGSVNPVLGLFGYANSPGPGYGVVGMTLTASGSGGGFINSSGTMVWLATETAGGLFQSNFGGNGGDNSALDTLIATNDGYSMKAPQPVLVGNTTDGFILSPNGDITDSVTSLVTDNIMTDNAWGKYIGKTILKQGNIGSYAAAKTLCATTFPTKPSPHVCTAQEIINSYELDTSGPLYTAPIPTESMWINNGPPAYISDLSNDCNGWTSASTTTNYGSSWNFTKKYSLISHCDRSLAVACCSY